MPLERQLRLLLALGGLARHVLCISRCSQIIGEICEKHPKRLLASILFVRRFSVFHPSARIRWTVSAVARGFFGTKL